MSGGLSPRCGRQPRATKNRARRAIGRRKRQRWDFSTICRLNQSQICSRGERLRAPNVARGTPKTEGFRRGGEASTARFWSWHSPDKSTVWAVHGPWSPSRIGPYGSEIPPHPRIYQHLSLDSWVVVSQRNTS